MRYGAGGEGMNEYLHDVYESVSYKWTPLSELDAPWAHLNELALDGLIEERVEELERDGHTVGSRFYYRKPKPGAYYTTYDPVQGSGGFLAAMSNPDWGFND